MQINIKISGLKDVQDKLKDMSDRRIKAATATALTRTAVQVRDIVKAEMATLLDRPTPYTVRQLRYVAATAQRPVAAVGFGVVAIQDQLGNVMRYQDLGASETPAGRYLHDQIYGGPRRDKRFEKALRHVGVLPQGWYAVPGQRAKIDKYGNQSVGEIRQILSWFDAAELTKGSTQNMRDKGRDKRRKGTRKTSAWEYFAVQPGGVRTFARSSGATGTHKMRPGVYRRTLTGFGSRIEPVVIFVRTAAYRRRFDFYGIAKREGDRILAAEMQRAINESFDRMNKGP